MKDTLQTYVDATNFARANNQTVGEKRDYYITLEQLQMILTK